MLQNVILSLALISILIPLGLFGVLGLAATGQVQRVAAPSSAVLAGDDVKTGGGGMG